MKRLCSIAVALVLSLGFAGAAAADIGTIDAVPAATLLLPHFEVDLSNASGKTTLMSINNASATATLGRVTLWTDLGVPTLTFNVYLTGYDVQTINLRDVLNGTLPATASDGQDPSDTISKQGLLSQDINFASCTGTLPYAALGASVVSELQAAHKGLAASTLFSNQCGGQALGDGIARGYVTVDVVDECSSNRPTDAGYFTNEATTQNILWGDYFYIDPLNNYAQGDTLVHIEADMTAPETNTPGDYTFYGRYVNWAATDHRESLPTSFATRFLNGGAFTGGTTLTAWRDSKSVQTPFNCGSSPSWYPLGQESIMAFDEQENYEAAGAITPFPAASGSVAVNGASFPVPFTFGWLFLNLNTTIAGNANPPSDSAAAQAWVTVIHSANGRFSTGYAAVQLDNARDAAHFVPGT